MKLHLTVNEKWIDSIQVDPTRREDKEYLEDKKFSLSLRNRDILNSPHSKATFYLDPFYVESLVSASSYKYCPKIS